ncbi:MAG TPA: lysozyme inhibitor LprI family protein [Methylomirabilota bacterium]|nr:lysozyme inhibitor LprI family protein [Methylomirabilota bacterium]
MRIRRSAFVAALALATLKTMTAGAAVGEAPPLAERIIENQLKALNDILAPDLQQALAQYQQHWTAYRDEQCRFELAFARGQGKATVHENAGREVGCINRLNQQRLGELQRYLSALMAATNRVAAAQENAAPPKE